MNPSSPDHDELPPEDLPPDQPLAAPAAPPLSAFRIFALVTAFTGLVIVIIVLVLWK